MTAIAELQRYVPVTVRASPKGPSMCKCPQGKYVVYHEAMAELQVWKNALYKACGDDSEVVQAYLDSQRPTEPQRTPR